GKCIRKRGKSRQLVMEHGSVKTEATRRYLPQCGTTARVLEYTVWRTMCHVAKRGIARVLHGDLTHSAKPVGCQGRRAIKHVTDLIAKPQVGMSDNGGTNAAVAVRTAVCHCADAVGELDFSERAQNFRPVRPGERLGFNEYRGDDPVTGIGVCQVVVEHVSQRRPIKQVVVRIDDRQVRVEDRFITDFMASMSQLMAPSLLW